MSWGFHRERFLHYGVAWTAVLLTLASSWRNGLVALVRPALRHGDWKLKVDPTSASVPDATGALVPRRDYRRIVAMEGIGYLLQLVPADRIVAVGGWQVKHAIEGWRVADRPYISETRQIEQILACGPDLVVTQSQGIPEEREGIALLRSLGIPVFDLSFATSFDEVTSHMVSLGALLQVPERGLARRDDAIRRCALLRTPMKAHPKPYRGVFMCTWGERITMSGIDDPAGAMISEAGLRNAGVEAGLVLEPVISLERGLVINPEILVTRPNNVHSLAQVPGIDTLTDHGRKNLYTIPEPLAGTEARLEFIDAVESIHDAAYSPSSTSAPSSSSKP